MMNDDVTMEASISLEGGERIHCHYHRLVDDIRVFICDEIYSKQTSSNTINPCTYVRDTTYVLRISEYTSTDERGAINY